MTELSGAELDAVIENSFAVMSRFTMNLFAALEQADAADRPAELAAPSFASWLRARFGQTPQDAFRLVREMKALRAAPVAADAALLGAIGVQRPPRSATRSPQCPPESARSCAPLTEH